jgi:hypothetical protein
MRLGVEPEALAAGGVSSTRVAGLFSRARDHLGEHEGIIGSADEELGAASAALTALEDKVRAGQSAPQDLAALAAARARVQTARTSRDALLASASAAVSTDLTEPQVATIQAVAGNRAWNLPVKYLVLNRSEAQWVSLRDALASQRINAARGREIEPAASLIVAQADAEPAVAAAASQMQSNGAAVGTAWAEALAAD